MKLMHSEWQGRLEHWLRTLRDDFYESLGEISWEAFRTMEQLSMEEAQTREFVPVQPGFTWGNIWEYCWFRGSITLPEQAKGQRIVMNLKQIGRASCRERV